MLSFLCEKKVRTTKYATEGDFLIVRILCSSNHIVTIALLSFCEEQKL